MKYFAFFAVFLALAGTLIFLLRPIAQAPKPKERTIFSTTDTTYFEYKGKECRLIQLRKANVKPCP